MTLLRLTLFATIFVLVFTYSCKPNLNDGYVESTNKISDIYHNSIGEGSPIIVIHGGPGLGSAYLENHLEELSKNHKVIFYDQRNSGRSILTEDSTKIRLNSFLKDIEELRQFYKLKKVHLLAHSWGGLLALNYVVHYSDKVDKLVLINSLSVDSKINDQANTRLANKFSADDLEARSRIMQTEAFKSQNPKAYEELMTLGFEYQFSDATKIDALDLQLPQDFAKKSGLLSHLYKDLYTYDFTEEAKKIIAPTLLLYGLDDPLTPFALNSLSAVLPNHNIKAIEKAGHFPFIEKRVETIAAIEDFLKE